MVRRVSAALLGLYVLCAPYLAVAQQVPNPVNAPPGTVMYATNADLAAAVTTGHSAAIRLGFAAMGDAPPLAYIPSNSPCSLNAGAGDNGSQVPSADGKCWVAVFGSDPLDVRQFGAKCDGSADDTAALIAADAVTGVGQLGIIKTCRLSNNLTLTHPLYIGPQGALSVDVAKTLTIASATIETAAPFPGAGTITYQRYERSVALFGADLTGAADASAKLNNCLSTSLSTPLGKKCIIDRGAIIRATSDIIIPAYTRLECGTTHGDAEDNPANFTNMPSIRLAGTAKFKAGGNGIEIKGCLVYRDGMTFPAADSTAYAGTAFDDQGHGNATITDSVFVGFDRVMLLSGTRPYVRHVYADCSGVTVACIDVENGNTDAGYFDEIKLQPLGTGNYNGTTVQCAAATRAGTGFKMAGINHAGSLTAQNFRTTQIASTAYLLANTLWVDFPVACLGTYTPLGINLTGGADIDHADLNSLTTGLKVNPGGPTVAINVKNAFCNSIGQDCVELAAGYLHINNISTNTGGINVGRYLVNYTDAGGNASLQLDGGLAIGVHGGVAPYINVANTVESLHMTIGEGIRTDLPTNAGFYGAAPTVGGCTGLGTGSCALNISSRSTPWKGQIIVGTSGAPAASGVAQLTFPMRTGNSASCKPTLQDGALAWPATSTVRMSAISSTVQQIIWNTNGAALGNQTDSYRITWDCAPQ